jgi:hypothetical protein
MTKKRRITLTAILLALFLSPQTTLYAVEDCGTSVTECKLWQAIKVLQERTAKLEKENQALRQKTDAITVLDRNRISFEGLILTGDKQNTNNGIGPALSFHSQFSSSKDNRNLYFHLGDTWNNSGVSKDDFVIHSWDHSYKNHVKHMVLRANGNVGIGTTPSEKLQVNGNVKAKAFKTGDIFFEKDGKTLWQMFEDENGLYLKQLKTGKTYRLMLEEIK